MSGMDVDEILVRRARAAGLDLDHLSDACQHVLPVLSQALEDVLPAAVHLMADDPDGRRVLAEALRSYAEALDQTT